MKDASYRADVVEAFCQYVRNYERLTSAQWVLLHSFTRSGKTYYQAAAEILLDLHEGAEIHEGGDYKTGKEAEAELASHAQRLFEQTKGKP